MEKQRVFENRVLRRIFGLERDEVMGRWRKLHIEELRYLYSWPTIIRIRIVEDEMGGVRNAYRLLVGKRSLGRL
jgi:PAS domain-containing protein